MNFIDVISDFLENIIKFRSSEYSLGATAKKWVVGNESILNALGEIGLRIY